MANSDKILTEDPFLDELMYNIKAMVLGTILKNDKLAKECETEESLERYELYRIIKEGTARFEMFEYTEKMIISVVPPTTYDQILFYFNNQDQIPLQYRDRLMQMAMDKYLETYEELNNYYRMINGKPDFGSIGLYLTEKDIPKDHLELFDLSIPIDQYSPSQIELLDNNGIIDNLKEKFPHLKYLWYLGNKSIDPYEARQLPRFAPLYVPDPLSPYSEIIYSKYCDALERNREILLRTAYSDAYELRSEHYDDFFSIMIIMGAFNEMLINLPVTLMHRDFFDARSIKFFFEANGVPYFDDIPLRYQIRLCKNLNHIIKTKSCDQLIVDVCEIFDMEEIRLYKYYLMKVHNQSNEPGKVFSDSGNPDKDYTLRFIRVPIGETLRSCIGKSENYLSYTEIAEIDGYWNGEESPGDVKASFLNKEFTVMRTEYLGVGAVVDIMQNSLKNAYFMNIIFDYCMNTDMLTVSVPSISSRVEFRLIDIFCLMYSLTYLYYGSTDDILLDPSATLTVLGFNFETNMKAIKEDLLNKYGTTLEDLGIPELIIPENLKLLTYTQLMEVYTTNKGILDLLGKQIYEADNYKMYKIYKEIYDAWMFREWNMKIYDVGGEMAPSYTAYLKFHSNILYEYLMTIKLEENENTKMEKIQSTMTNVIAALENLITIKDFQAVLQFFPFSNMFSIRAYILEIIQFFKSINAEIIGANSHYNINYPYEEHFKFYDIIDKIDVHFYWDDWVIIDDIIHGLTIYMDKEDYVRIREKIYRDYSHSVQLPIEYTTERFEVREEIELKPIYS